MATSMLNKEIAELLLKVETAMNVAIDDYIKQEEDNADYVAELRSNVMSANQSLTEYLINLSSSEADYASEVLLSSYHHVLADIDTDLIWKDEQYCLAVMKNLLNQHRVEEYLNRGLQESPEVPCGKYVGGVQKRGEVYKKVFFRQLGEASHNSQEMVNERQRLNEELKQKREQERARKLAQIAKLQQELDDMDR